MTTATKDLAAASESGVRRLNLALGPEARYQALVGILPDVLVALFDRDLRIFALEGGATEHLEHPPEWYEGRHLDEFLSANLMRQIEPRYRAALQGEQSSFDLDGDHGDAWWVTVIPMYDTNGNVSGGLAKWRDITARKAAERELAAYARDLERSNAELKQFAYVASHDLNEPLRMITGYLKLLERRYGDQLDEDAHQFMAFAVDGAHRMRELIEDLLAYSRVGHDGQPPELVDTQALVETTWRTLTVEREGPEATLLATGLPTVRGDRQQLTQLFQNLLANAVKFVRPGAAAVVDVHAEALPEGWRFTVDDEGIGLGEADTERIFRVFQRLHTRDEYGGSGIGLAIARKVVEGHGGQIWAQQRPGGGARFVFDLPGA